MVYDLGQARDQGAPNRIYCLCIVYVCVGERASE